MSADIGGWSDMYVAIYADRNAAEEARDALQALASSDTIKLDGLIMVSRGDDHKIHIEDGHHKTGKGAVWGAVGGVVAGLIFPPSVLVGAALGAGFGAGLGELMSLADKVAIEADLGPTLPVNGCGILALVEHRFADTVGTSLSTADSVTEWKVDGASVQQITSIVAADPATANR